MAGNRNDNLRFFQLYLLSAMRAEPRVVEEALKRLEASEEELNLAKETAVNLGFEAIIVTAELYRDILGSPIAVEPVDNNTLPPPFHGSRLLRFELPLWEGFDFTVHEHPDGRAWKPNFRRPSVSTLPILNSFADLKPWNSIKEDISQNFGIPEFGDAWDFWEEIYYMIPLNPNERPHRCLLIFDYNLLQSFEASD